MESKGLRVNINKTKVMKCFADADVRVETGKYPCGVCGTGVGSNSILCVECGKWIHRKCSGIKGILRENMKYRCTRCRMGVGVVAVEEVGKEIVMEDGSKFECVSKFCYLGDMLTAAGGVAEASIVRTRCAWKQF